LLSRYPMYKNNTALLK